MQNGLIDKIRTFNRHYTETMGFLSRDYLGTGRPLSELRVLFDLGNYAPGPMRDMSHAWISTKDI